jgi:hypothetical protein
MDPYFDETARMMSWSRVVAGYLKLAMQMLPENLGLGA